MSECRTAELKRMQWDMSPEARKPTVLPGLDESRDVTVPVQTAAGVVDVTVPADVHRGTLHLMERMDGLYGNGQRLATWEELEEQAAEQVP